VLGHRYYGFDVASPPYDLVSGESGLHVVFNSEGDQDGAGLAPPAADIEGADRQLTSRLAHSLAEALAIPVWVEPQGGPHWP